jgi:uncharacterized protein with von Willebrand factor type A (vWA) domain
MIKLKEETIMPAMCSIKTSGGAKSNVDLICVIDVSGSMSGDKIQLVRDTMKFLLETLTPDDRLCIITFNDRGRRINGLKRVTKENMAILESNIGGLNAGGGTNINSGLNLALRIQSLQSSCFPTGKMEELSRSSPNPYKTKKTKILVLSRSTLSVSAPTTTSNL